MVCASRALFEHLKDLRVGLESQSYLLALQFRQARLPSYPFNVDRRLDFAIEFFCVGRDSAQIDCSVFSWCNIFLFQIRNRNRITISLNLLDVVLKPYGVSPSDQRGDDNEYRHEAD